RELALAGRGGRAVRPRWHRVRTGAGHSVDARGPDAGAEGGEGVRIARATQSAPEPEPGAGRLANRLHTAHSRGGRPLPADAVEPAINSARIQQRAVVDVS